MGRHWYHRVTKSHIFPKEVYVPIYWISRVNEKAVRSPRSLLTAYNHTPVTPDLTHLLES
jgi:hypothetical protein